MQMDKWLRYVIIAGIFLLPLIPLIIARDMFFPFITGKNFAFRIIIEIVFASWIILAFRNPLYRPRFSWVLGAIALFVGVLTLAALLGENPLRSFWSNFERMEGLVTHLHLFAYFIVLASVLNAKKLWWWFANTSLGVSVLLGIYSILQLAGYITINQGGVRIDATFGNATYLAVYVLFHIFIALILLVRREERLWLRFVYGGVILLNLFVLFNTATRGAILGFVGGALVTTFLFALFSKNRPTLRKIAAGALAGIVLFVGGFILFRDANFIESNPVLTRFNDISLEEGASRFMIWGMAWQGAKEHPIFGWGQDNFVPLFSKYYNPEMYNEEPWFDRAHNVIFDWLVAGGFLGLLAYLSIFVAALYLLWVHRRKDSPFTLAQQSIFTGLFAAYFFQNLFVFDQIGSYLLFFGVLAFLHQSATVDSSLQKEEAIRGKAKTGMPLYVVASIVIVVTAFLVYGLNAPGMRTARAIIDGIDTRPLFAAQTPETRTAALQENVRGFETAVTSGYLGRIEAREQLILFANRVGSQLTNPEIRQTIFTFAEQEAKKQIEEAPRNTRHWMFLGSLYVLHGNPNEAIATLEEARKITPLKQHLLYMLSNSYIDIGEYEKGVAIAKEAWEAAPENGAALERYAAALIYARRFREAEESLRTLQGADAQDALLSTTLINAYAAVGRFDRAAKLWEQRVKADPNNAQFHVSLAAAYMELGRFADSIRELEKAAEIDLSVKQQTDYWISELRAGRKPR